ncbi:MAG: hypothetical protein IPO81_11265 [Kouleothrix sp.]|nr:hypothetical protein [Kouleothrix sp.]
MSHELRTPLNAIIGFTGTLLMKLPGPLNADQDKQLKTIQSSARHLLSLINDLLDVAKIESGKLKIYPEPVTCQEVLDEAVASLRPLADQKGLRLTADCPPEPIVLQTDRRSLSQIVINLVNNAIKFTEKGEVAISLRRTASNPAGSTAAVGRPLVVAFAVRDTGIGIKAEDQDRLFHAFEQISSAKAGRREGSGLGLHLSMRLAELIGGRIEFQSEYGVGSIFTLFMPEQ